MLVLDELRKQVMQNEEECKGLFFRCNVNTYFRNNRYVEQVSFTLLKRKSCTGCEKCGWMLEQLDEFAICDGVDFDAEDKALYRLEVINEHRDFETGLVDDYDFKFEEVVEQQGGKG